MASIQTVVRSSGTAYRVQIRRKGLRAISKVFDTKQLAVKFARRVEGDRQVLQAYGHSYNKLIFADVVDAYFEYSYIGKRPKEQRWKLDYWVNCIGSKRIVEVNRVDIINGINSLPSHYKNSTVNRFKAAVSAVFTFACKQFELPDNPVRYVSSKPENNERTRYLTKDERKYLFEACRVSSWDRLYLLVLLALTTGARRSELLNLKWNNVDWDNNQAYVETSKNGHPRVLPLTKEAIKELRLFKQDGNILIFKSIINPNKPFCFSKSWGKALKEAGITDFTFHSLRHTTASYLAQSGASLLEIGNVLGHKSLSVTKRYAHLCVESKTKLVNAVLGGISDTEYVPKPHR